MRFWASHNQRTTYKVTLMIIVFICFLLLFILICLSSVWKHRGTRQGAIVKNNRRVAQRCRENIIYEEDTFAPRDKLQLELFDNAEWLDPAF